MCCDCILWRDRETQRHVVNKIHFVPLSLSLSQSMEVCANAFNAIYYYKYVFRFTYPTRNILLHRCDCSRWTVWKCNETGCGSEQPMMMNNMRPFELAYNIPANEFKKKSFSRSSWTKCEWQWSVDIEICRSIWCGSRRRYFSFLQREQLVSHQMSHRRCRVSARSLESLTLLNVLCSLLIPFVPYRTALAWSGSRTWIKWLQPQTQWSSFWMPFTHSHTREHDSDNLWHFICGDTFSSDEKRKFFSMWQMRLIIFSFDIRTLRPMVAVKNQDFCQSTASTTANQTHSHCEWLQSINIYKNHFKTRETENKWFWSFVFRVSFSLLVLLGIH